MRNGFYSLQERYMEDLYTYYNVELASIKENLSIVHNGKPETIAVSVSSFLLGFCAELALYFCDKCNLSISVLYDKYHDDVIHVYNTFYDRFGQKYYLDARGITDDEELFFAPYKHYCAEVIGPLTRTETETLIRPEGWEFPEDEISDAMIQWLVTSFPENYDIQSVILTHSKIASGFYKELEELRNDCSEANFCFLENIKVTSKNNAYNYLHGRCDKFAAMLSEMYGYEIECIRNADNKLIHAYCVGEMNGEKAYIDVRGITTDPVLFYEEFEDELTYYPEYDIVYVSTDKGYELLAKIEVCKNKDELFDGGFEGWKDEELREFIRLNCHYYAEKQNLYYVCIEDGEKFLVADEYWFEDYGEEELWGHIQSNHPECFEECQDWDTPTMLDVFYETVIEKEILQEKNNTVKDNLLLDSQIHLASKRSEKITNNCKINDIDTHSHEL